jgi:PHD/YefM family antitoxin component YafN of YafNO toxin-antitoxin module
MLEQMSVNNILHSIIPISRFNKGEANKIFDEVGVSGYKIVVKNNKPTCVLLSPEKYEEIMEALENYTLYLEAEKRINELDSSETISHEDILSNLGINKTELNAIEVEID